MGRIFCIYPVDDTTEFLRPIYNVLMQFAAFVNVPTITTNDIASALTDCNGDDLIVFLGHGASYCLYNKGRKKLITKCELQLFAEKNVFLLACRSSDFINSNKVVHLKNYIGFGDIPTDWDEIEAERESDANAYPDVDKVVIESYKAILTRVVADSLLYMTQSGSDFRQLHLRLKLLFNKHITHLLRDEGKCSRNIALARLLYETKIGMTVKQ